MGLFALAVVLSVFGLTMIADGASAAEEPFYQGKNVTFVINFAAGGPTDIEGRIGERLKQEVTQVSPEIVDFVRQYVDQARK